MAIRRGGVDKPYADGNGMLADNYQAGNDIYQKNDDQKTIDELVDFVQADLTFSGMLPKTLPDMEIVRLVKENALEWFYKNYQHAVMKTYFRLGKEHINTEEYTAMGYITLPEEVENITRIVEISNPSLFSIGVQAPNLSINFGVTNQPYLTSFVTNVGELATYRQILSSFSDEINKLSRNYTKFSFNPVNKRFHILDQVRADFMLDLYVRIQQEEVFNNHLFKDLVVGMARVRLGEMLGRLTFDMPGNFQYNAADLISQGSELVTATKEKVKGESPNSSSFILAR